MVYEKEVEKPIRKFKTWLLKPSMEAHASNHSTREAKAKGYEFQANWTLVRL